MGSGVLCVCSVLSLRCLDARSESQIPTLFPLRSAPPCARSDARARACPDQPPPTGCESAPGPGQARLNPAAEELGGRPTFEWRCAPACRLVKSLAFVHESSVMVRSRGPRPDGTLHRPDPAAFSPTTGLREHGVLHAESTACPQTRLAAGSSGNLPGFRRQERAQTLALQVRHSRHGAGVPRRRRKGERPTPPVCPMGLA